MASTSMKHGDTISSRRPNIVKGSSSSVERLGREMLEMKLKDRRADTDEDKAPRRAISRGRGVAKGPHWPRTNDMLVHLKMVVVCLSKEPVNYHNHFEHDGTRDSEVRHAFDGHIPL
ncbi:uncharacterized protein A4U43_C08F16990 [Asparagus officinalis]|nr:uncharacterized protein A4U43_C08F16990 [Asparagus officinalis]